MSAAVSDGPIPILTGVASLAAGTDAWICDIWGVIHNGLAAFTPAVEACRRFRNAGGTVLLLTNAPRPAEAIHAQLDRLGVARDAWDAVLTSGDLTRQLIAASRDRPMLHLGPERDRGLFDGQSVRLVDVDAAEVIVCSGLYDDETERAEDYRARLTGPARRRVPMICANPDLTVARGDRVIPCAGALASLYETLGGPVTWAGKPHLPVYTRALEMITASRGGRAPKSDRILAIGDGVRTDMLGAANAGLDALFVASPVHVGEALSLAVLDKLFAGAPARPLAAMSGLAW